MGDPEPVGKGRKAGYQVFLGGVAGFLLGQLLAGTWEVEEGGVGVMAWWQAMPAQVIPSPCPNREELGTNQSMKNGRVGRR